MNLAPWWPSSPGWNMNSTRPASSARRALSSSGGADEHRRVRVVAAGVHRALDVRAKSSPVSSGIGRASMSPRSRIVGPGLPPSSSAAMPLVDSCRVMSSGQAVERGQHGLAGDRQVVAELRPLVQRRGAARPSRRAGRGPPSRSGRRRVHRRMVRPWPAMRRTRRGARRHRRRRRQRDRDGHAGRRCAPAACSTARSASPCSARDGRLLVHRRSRRPRTCGRVWWDIAAGGVVAAGESYDERRAASSAEEIGVHGDVELESRRRPLRRRRRALRSCAATRSSTTGRSASTTVRWSRCAGSTFAELDELLATRRSCRTASPCCCRCSTCRAECRSAATPAVDSAACASAPSGALEKEHHVSLYGANPEQLSARSASR